VELLRLCSSPDAVKFSNIAAIWRANRNNCYHLREKYVAIKLNRTSRKWKTLCSAYGWGTALQAGKSWVPFPMRSLRFFIDLICSAALWSWSRLSLWQKWVLGIFLAGVGDDGGKCGRCVRLTTLPPSISIKNPGSLNLLKSSDTI
jgi:hypothetical protein